MTTDLRQLFSADSAAAFADGQAAQLVTNRNAQLGNLLATERGIYYVQLLYGMLRFRRRHEVEPLHDDLYREVQPAQEAVGDGEGYSPERFREDVAALLEWRLIAQRIELERLRGYRDTRRKKFRYSLPEETIAFLEWLEERLQDDLDAHGADTRDLLEELCGALRELSRVLHRVHTKLEEEGDSRRVLFQLDRLDSLTHAVTEALVSLNARMLSFVMRHYTVGEARQILRELETFVDAFLRQIHTLRGEITDKLDAVTGEAAGTKIGGCIETMEAERRQAPHLLRRMRDPAHLAQIPAALTTFYREDGTLDVLCRRISATAMQVWHKLHRHLRELERTNHRLDDLRARIAEIAALPPEAVPRSFIRELLAPAHLATDPQYWDAQEKADPPEPRRDAARRGERTRTPLPDKARHDGPVRTLEQKRLALLQAWVERHVLPPGVVGALLAAGRFDEFDDLVRVMELVKAGQLGRGRKLATIGYRLEDGDGRDCLEADDYLLTVPEMRVVRGGTSQ
jgi:hypothetical protein